MKKYLPILSAIPLAITGCASQTPKQPNIMFILCDDAGYADFGFNGSTDLKTPNIDKLASEGTILTDAHTSASVSGPSRAGIMTGRYQQRFGFEGNPPANGSVDLKEITIASALKEAGYQTSGFGKWHLGSDVAHRPNNRGFNYYYGFLSGGRGYFMNKENDVEGNNHSIRENDHFVTFKGYLTDVLANKAVAYIKNRDRNKPFFMYWGPNAVHTPMQAKQSDLDLFKGHKRQTLAAMTYALDRGVGDIVKALKDEKIYDNTLFFFLSDNGGSPENTSSCYPLKGFKGNKFEGGIRVPYFVVWKGHVLKGQKFSGLSSSLDIYATSLAAAMTPLKEEGKDISNLTKIANKLDGVNLIPYLSGKKTGNPHSALFWRKEEEAAARIGNMKLIRVKNLGERLYNLKTDLGETKDLTKLNKKDLENLNNQLDKWESNMIKPLWSEGEKWLDVTWNIHKDLFFNKKVRATSPSKLKNYYKNHPNEKDSYKISK